MVEAWILDGDLTALRRQPTAEGNETVAAVVDSLATVKRPHREAARVWMVPANPAPATLVITDSGGVVVGMVRYP